MKKWIIVIIISLIFFVRCSNHRYPYFNLINENNKIFEIGSNDENKLESLHVYKIINEYYVDYINNIFVGDFGEKKIDKFSKEGTYICSFGREGQGPGEFSAAVPYFAADSKGFLYTSYIKYIDIFNPNGNFIKRVLLPEQYKNFFTLRIKIDSLDNIYILFSNGRNRFKVVKTDKNFNNFHIIHINENRNYGDKNIPNALGLFKPDFDFDKNNNIYITDNINYKIYIYSQWGNLIKKFEKDFKKHEITKKDLDFPTFKGDEIVNLPITFLNELKGVYHYFPAIFGINVDEEKVFLWTSDLDREHKFFIDIYDANFKFIGRSSYYNDIKNNMVIIRNKILYTLNIESDDMEFKNKFGRFVFFNVPYKVYGYKINKINTD